jgi:AraC-like DNA-binding protein
MRMVTTLAGSAQETTFRPTGHDLAIASVITAMRKHPQQQLTLDQQAEIAGFSPYHFARLFRDTIGIPPGEFQSALRFARGKELLLQTDASVTDICFDIGFESLGTFSSRFRQLVGVSPQTYRRLPAVVSPELFQERDPAELLALPPGPFGTLQGQIQHPAGTENTPMSVYIGVFSAAIARGFPVSGTFLKEHGAYQIDGIPPGTYTLLAAAVPTAAGPMEHINPGTALRVASPQQKIVIAHAGDTAHMDVTLRPLSMCDPPILITLPALVMTPKYIRNREEVLGLPHD